MHIDINDWHRRGVTAFVFDDGRVRAPCSTDLGGVGPDDHVLAFATAGGYGSDDSHPVWYRPDGWANIDSRLDDAPGFANERFPYVVAPAHVWVVNDGHRPPAPPPGYSLSVRLRTGSQFRTGGPYGLRWWHDGSGADIVAYAYHRHTEHAPAAPVPAAPTIEVIEVTPYVAAVLAADIIESDSRRYRFMQSHVPHTCVDDGCVLGWIAYVLGANDIVEAARFMGYDDDCDFYNAMRACSPDIDADQWQHDAGACVRTLRALARRDHRRRAS